ncbi:hypothetical protein KCU78_g46, partial [Aureobasidium melanogenum]
LDAIRGYHYGSSAISFITDIFPSYIITRFVAKTLTLFIACRGNRGYTNRLGGCVFEMLSSALTSSESSLINLIFSSIRDGVTDLGITELPRATIKYQWDALVAEENSTRRNIINPQFLAEGGNGKVGNADGLCFAGLKNGFHFFPRTGQCIRDFRLRSRFSSTHVLALDARLEAFGQTLTNFIFVAVDVSSVNMLVADLESVRNSILDLAGSRLPRSQTCTKLSPHVKLANSNHTYREQGS